MAKKLFCVLQRNDMEWIFKYKKCALCDFNVYVLFAFSCNNQKLTPCYYTCDDIKT